MEHGCERFLHVMNEYFSRLLTIVEEYNGDVICFAGDAMMAVWHDENAAEAARLASHCCVHLIEKESPYKCKDGTILRLHATVASGKITMIDLGRRHHACWPVERTVAVITWLGANNP
jgi:class 3 adenylate cyclase